MGVGAGYAEGVDSGQGQTAGTARPVRILRSNAHWQPFPVQARVGIAEIQVLGNRPSFHRQHCLDETGDSRRRFQVADVGFHRTNQQRAFLFPFPAVYRHCGIDLDGVADLGSRAVGFQIVHVGGGDASPRQGRLHQLLLGRAIGHRESHSGTGMVDSRAADYAPDAVSVRLGLTQPFQHDHTAALASHIAVCGSVEGLALAVGRQYPGSGAKLESLTVDEGVHAARQGQIRLSLLQAGHCLMHGNQRRRAGGVHRKCRPIQSQHICYPSADGVQGSAGEGIEAGRRFGEVGGFVDQPPVFYVAYPGVHPGAAAFQPVRVQPRVFKGVPANLQHHPLLRVQQLRFNRRNTEERRVKQVNIVNVSAKPAGRQFRGSVMEEFAHAPHPGTVRTLGHRISARLQQTPETGKALAAGEPAGHAYDGYRLQGPGNVRLSGTGSSGRFQWIIAIPVWFNHNFRPGI